MESPLLEDDMLQLQEEGQYADDVVIGLKEALGATDDTEIIGDTPQLATLSKKPSRRQSKGKNGTHTFLSSNKSYKSMMDTAGTEEELPKLGARAVGVRLFRLGKAQKVLIGWATLALVVSSIASMAIPSFIGKIIDAVSVNGSMDQLNSAVLGMFLFTAISSLFAFFRNLCFTLAGERVVAQLRRMLFAAILQQEIGFFDRTRTGDLVNRLSSDCQIIQNAATVNVSMALRFTGQLIAGITFLFYISWKLTLLMLSVVPLLIIGASLFGRYVRKISKQVQDALAKSGEVSSEVIGAIRTVRSFSKDDDESNRYALCVNESYRLAAQRARVRGAFSGVATFLGGVSVLLVLWYGGKLVIDKEMTPGTLTSFILYTVTVSFALGALSELYSDFMKAVGSSEKVFQLIDRKPKIAPFGGQRLSTEINGTVEFESVSFAYPTRSEQLVLHELSLKLEPGKVVALVGPSGGGKSTCVNLLLGFYRPQKGKILVDGCDLAQLDAPSVRRHIATVSQEPTLFATTIAENIAYGVEFGVSDAEIIAAAKVANAHEFIESFENGYHTIVGERGVKLSGGQRQRIAIARAVLKKPTILLLDEATSALDAEAEHLVKEALQNLLKGRKTVLIIAHRLSTVKQADEVIVIDDGRAAERGTHEELLARGGIYNRLVQRQLADD